MSADLATHGKHQATTHDEFKKENQSLIWVIKRQWKSLPLELTLKLVHSMNNRISEVIGSHGNFILL